MNQLNVPVSNIEAGASLCISTVKNEKLFPTLKYVNVYRNNQKLWTIYRKAEGANTTYLWCSNRAVTLHKPLANGEGGP